MGERARADRQRRRLVRGVTETEGGHAAGALPRRGRAALPAETGAGTSEGVTLMTLHTAKGLEWPVVVLAGLEDGLFPLARAEEQPDGLEEERRLFYVAITRAKDKLYLTWARARRRGGEIRPGMPSRFLRATAAGHRRGEEDLLAVGAGLGRDGGTAGRRDRRVAARPRFGGRHRSPPSRRPPRRRTSLTGHAPLRQRRAGPAPPLRQRDDPGADRAPGRTSRSRSRSTTRRSD